MAFWRKTILAAGVAIWRYIGLNFVLIPSRGIEGAAMATAASLVIVLGITLVCVERHFAAEGVARGAGQHGGRARRREHPCDPGDEVIGIRHVGENVVAEQEVGLAILGNQRN